MQKCINDLISVIICIIYKFPASVFTNNDIVVTPERLEGKFLAQLTINT